MASFVSRALRLRLNRRYFWIGFGVMAGGTMLLAQSYPWVLNGGFALPWLLLHAARLHDFGWRGLWALFVVAAVLACLVGLATLKPPTIVYGPAALVAFLAIAAFTLWAGAKAGDGGTNRFGPAPSGWALR